MEIAQKLEISKRTLYELFSDKDTLVGECWDKIREEQEKKIEDLEEELAKAKNELKELQDKAKNMEEARTQLGVVEYEKNVLGSKGPRRMKVLLPRIERDGSAFEWKSNDVRLPKSSK